MGSTFLLEIENATARMQGREVLKQVSLAISPGEIVTVIGPNGAGKTTLLRVALGLLPPTAGQVRRRPRLRIGYMPQRLHIDGTLPLSVRRFLSLARRGAVEDLEATLEEVGALQTADSPLQALSGG
nr:ATP-binding cassette domain-containing protein [Desulfuromonas sp.]